MVADKPKKDLVSSLYAEWISAGLKLCLVGLETTAKMFASARQTTVAKKSDAPVKDAAPTAVSEIADLKLISGIGPKLEILLKNNGISSVNQIAVLSDDDVAKLDAALNLNGRIQRDKWIGQAVKYAQNTGGQTWQK